MSAPSASSALKTSSARHVALLGLLEDLEDLDARQRGLQAAALQFVGVGHGAERRGARGAADRIVASYELAGARGRRERHPHDDDSPIPMPALRLALAAASIAALAGCQSLQSSDSFLGVITPYRIEIVQGNVITKEQVGAASSPGMTRAQVRDVLGSPLLDRPVPRRPLGLRLHDPPPGRRAAAAPRGRAASRATRWRASNRRPSCPREREFVASIDTFKTLAPRRRRSR